MRTVKNIALPSLAIALIGMAGMLFVNLFVAIQADGAGIQVRLLNPPNGSLLSGSIYTSAETSAHVSKVEFYFLDEEGRFTFTYEGVNSGGNSWEYTWTTDESIDGVYRVHAIAVDDNNSTYISDINQIFVNNDGGSIPDFDQNSNSSPFGNYNVNQSVNTNYNTNQEGNFNQNYNSNTNQEQNTNSEIVNTNSPANNNLNSGVNTNNPVSENSNTSLNSNGSLNTNTALPEESDSDKDGLSNNEEIEAGTDVNNPDTDNDGLTDGFEKKHSFNPLINDNATPSRTPDQTIIQAIIDARFGGTDAAKDTDRDGLPDIVEREFGSDPLRPDSSGDGLTDGFKANNGYSLLQDNTEQIAKKMLELPNPDINSAGKESATATIAIFGTLVLIIIIVLIAFRPKKLK